MNSVFRKGGVLIYCSLVILFGLIIAAHIPEAVQQIRDHFRPIPPWKDVTFVFLMVYTMAGWIAVILMHLSKVIKNGWR